MISPAKDVNFLAAGGVCPLAQRGQIRGLRRASLMPAIGSAMFRAKGFMVSLRMASRYRACEGSCEGLDYVAREGRYLEDA